MFLYMSFQIAKVFQMLPVFNEKRVWTDTGQDTSGSDSSALFYPESSSPEGRYTSMSVFSSKQEKLQGDLGEKGQSFCTIQQNQQEF